MIESLLIATDGSDASHVAERYGAALGARLRARLDDESDLAGRVAAACDLLFHVERFRGNRDDYEDPRNSYLDQVLERRQGIPITLSIVFVDVARRAGLDASGIGFPGHFLAKVVDERARQGAAAVADAVDEALQRGFLPAYPSKGACRWCDFRPVCGPHEEARTGRKLAEDERLHRLTHVRSWS